jgi:hypothetical protein
LKSEGTLVEYVRIAGLAPKAGTILSMVLRVMGAVWKAARVAARGSVEITERNMFALKCQTRFALSFM